MLERILWCGGVAAVVTGLPTLETEVSTSVEGAQLGPWCDEVGDGIECG